jgi:hypothetical protein
MVLSQLLFIITLSLFSVAIGQVTSGTFYSDTGCTLGLPSPQFGVSNPFTIPPNTCAFVGKYVDGDLYAKSVSCNKGGSWRANYFKDSGCVTPYAPLPFREGTDGACITTALPSPAMSMKVVCQSSSSTTVVAFSAAFAAFALFCL